MQRFPFVLAVAIALGISATLAGATPSVAGGALRPSVAGTPAHRGTGQPGVYTSVAALSASDGWAVGWVGSGEYEAQLLVRHWDGTSWERVPAPHPGAASSLRSVSAVAPDDVWAVGQYHVGDGHNRPLVLHWDGTSWQRTPITRVHGGASGVSVLAADDVWVVGVPDRSIHPSWAEHWDGSSWAPLALPSHGALDAVDAVADDDVWVAGTVGTGDDSTLVEHWDGASWTVEKTANPDPFHNVFQGISATSTGDVFAAGWCGHEEVRRAAQAAGGCGDSGQALLAERWTGTRFTALAPPDIPDRSSFNGVDATSAGSAWFAGWAGSSALIARWDGTAWSTTTLAPKDNRDAGLNGISQDSSTDAWAVGSYIPLNGSGPGDSLTYVVEWDGQSWRTR